MACGPIDCRVCEDDIVGDYQLYSDDFICCSCAEQMAEDLKSQAIDHASSACKLDAELPIFDPATSRTITPDEYANGARESNTENAYRCRLRHDFSNYDTLISQLDRDCCIDSITYQAIRARMDEMIDERIDDDDLIRIERECDET